MPKQLITGLVIGAACTGLAVFLLGGARVPAPEVSDSGNLKLLAQVIPNEASSSVADEDAEPTDSEGGDVIEVRAAAPVAAKSKVAELAIVPDSEEDPEVSEAQPVRCAYVTDEKPNHDGIINEVAWMGSGEDANAEWVEIQNRTKNPLDVSGWQLVDKAEQIRAVIPEEVVLARGGFLLFERDKHLLPGATVLYKGALSNTDEGLRLFNAQCELQDEVIAKSKWPAGTNSPKYTAERDKNLNWHTYYGDGEAGIFGTPGKKNSAEPPPEPEPEPEPEQPSPDSAAAEEPTASSSEPDPQVSEPTPTIVASGQLIISEVMAGALGNVDDEFVELYNNTDTEISLEGFSIKKKTPTEAGGVTEASLVAAAKFFGKKVAAGAHFVIGREGKFTGVSDATWSPSNYLVDKSKFGSLSLVLYNAQGEKIDEVIWVEIPAGQSYACASQGSCSVQEAPSPGN